MNLQWMEWTLPTAIFFITLIVMISGMLVWELVSPTIERKGLLPMATTRGTRFFIGLLGSAYITLGWIGLTDLSLWFALGISIVWMTLVIRFG